MSSASVGVAPRRSRKSSHGVADQQGVRRTGGQQHQAHQQRRPRPAMRGHVHGTGAASARRAVVHDQAIGRKAAHGEEQIEARDVGGHEDAEVAGEREQPPRGEARAVSLVAQISRGIGAGADPEQRRDSEKHRAGHIERERGAEERIGAGPETLRRPRAAAAMSAGTGASAKRCRHARPHARRQARQQHGERHGQCGGEQRFGTGHGVSFPLLQGGRSAAASTARSGTRPSSSAQIASASGTASRLRDTVARRVRRRSRPPSLGPATRIT